MKNFIVVIIFILFFSCNKTNQKPTNQPTISLIGTWAGCDDDGFYLEIHFNNYSAMTCHEDVLDFAFIAPYTIWKDSIYYYNHIVDKMLPDKFVIVNNELTTYHDNVQKFNLKKINDTPLYHLECDFNYSKPLNSIAKRHYDYMFLKRKSEWICTKNESPR